MVLEKVEPDLGETRLRISRVTAIPRFVIRFKALLEQAV